VRTLEDTNARLLMLVGGAADFAQNTVRADLIRDVQRKPRLKIERGRSAILTYLVLKNDDPILGDVRVRRAIAHAIDRKAIIDAKYGGGAQLATGLIAPGHWAYEGDVARYDYDPARARALLDEAGHPMGKTEDGKRFTLVFKVSSDQHRVATARIIAQQLEAVGIGVDLRSFEWQTYFADIKRGNFQIGMMQTGEIAEPDMHWVFFHSGRIPTPDKPDGANRARYHDAEADRLIEEGRRVVDRAERKRIYGALQKIIARDLPWVPLWHEDNVAILNKDVEGYLVVPTARFIGWASVHKR
jgi:peptide/nickel transport system substrate-binding protein